MFHLLSKHLKSGLEKRGAAELYFVVVVVFFFPFFIQLRRFWKSNETFFRAFDIASQTIHNSWSNSKQNFTKFYDN